MQCVGTLVASEATFLDSAERESHVALLITVDPDHPRSQRASDAVDGRDVPPPDSGRQAVPSSVGDADRLVLAGDPNDGEHGAENLVLCDPGFGSDVIQHDRREVGTALESGHYCAPGAPRGQRRTLLEGVGHLLLDPGERIEADDRTEPGGRIERIRRLQCGRDLAGDGDGLVGMLVENDQPRRGAAHLSLVEEGVLRCTRRRRAYVGVAQHHRGGLPSEFGPHPLAVRLGAVVHECPPGRRRSGEGHHVHVGVSPQCLTRFTPQSVDDVEDAVRQSGSTTELRQEQCREGRLLSGFQNHRVAGQERRGELPDRHGEREVPGHNGRNDSSGLLDRIGEHRILVCEQCIRPLPCELAVPSQTLLDRCEFHVQRLGDRFTHLQGHGRCQVAGAFRHEPCPLHEHVAALAHGRAGPSRGVECPTSDGDRVVDEGPVRGVQVSDRTSVTRGDDGHAIGAADVHEPSADVGTLTKLYFVPGVRDDRHVTDLSVNWIRNFRQ
ncbi:hypothetical protein RHCRD62_30206 [Rhodococcus sp. RD6.2]|nr:hypothetical protein RHCRD62_30206 [Rhodococcus sp. RD6.2]